MSNTKSVSVAQFITILVKLKKYISRNKVKSSILFMPIMLLIRYIYCKLIRYMYQLPPGPIGFPIFGVLLSIKPPFIRIPDFAKIAEKYGPVTMFSLGPLSEVLISDSKIAKQVIRQRCALNRWDMIFENYGPAQTGILSILDADDYKTQALIMISNQDWMRRRKLITTTIVRHLTNKVLNEIMNNSFENTLVKYLDNIVNKNELWSPKEVLEYITFNTIFVSSFGDQNVKMNDELYKKVSGFVDTSVSLAANGILFLIVKYPHIFMPKRFKKFNDWCSEKNTFFKNMVLKKLNQSQQSKDINEKKCQYVADVFVELIKNNEMTVEEAYIDLWLLFFAGMHTTTHTSNFGIALIIQNSGENGIIEEIRQELLSVMKEKNEESGTVKLNLRKVNECPLFRAFVYECLRISSVVPRGVSHVSSRDIWVKTDDGNKYRIPAKMQIKYYSDYIHRISKVEENRNWIYGGGDKVNLKNWLVKYENDDRYYFVKNDAFLGFGVGRRDCVGKSVAIKELYAMLGFIILNYKLSSDKPIEVKRKFQPTLVILDMDIKAKIERIYYD
eukprot:45402_1